LIQAAVLGGLFIGILSALPGVSLGNCCCCLWIVCGGFLACYLLQSNQPAPVTTGQGAAVGLLAGVVGAVVWFVAAIAVNALMGPLQEQMIEQMLERAGEMPPEVRELLEQARDESGTALSYLVGFLIFLFGGAVFSTVGGVLATIFRREPPRVLPGADVTPPPLP
jgi:hypothetical protein